jgi:hypothetical protein
MTTPSRGYALLLAILIANVILAMSLGIFSIALKEVVLATYIRDSQSAFAAADHMLECALYWDMASAHNGMPYAIFATSSSPGYTTIPAATLDLAVCDGVRLDNSGAGGTGWNVITTGPPAPSGITTFALKFPDGTCADVRVLKDSLGMLVTSNGYNNCNVNNPRRTQRTIEVSTNL